MILRYLPNAGQGPWSERTGYEVHDTAWAGDDVIVLGRETCDGRPTDWFVAVYDSQGNRRSGSGARTTPSIERARELFDACTETRRKEARKARRKKAAA